MNNPTNMPLATMIGMHSKTPIKTYHQSISSLRI